MLKHYYSVSVAWIFVWRETAYGSERLTCCGCLRSGTRPTRGWDFLRIKQTGVQPWHGGWTAHGLYICVSHLYQTALTVESQSITLEIQKES